MVGATAALTRGATRRGAPFGGRGAGRGGAAGAGAPGGRGWGVLLGRAGGDDDGVVAGGQERLDLRAGHLAEEHGRRLHRGPSFAGCWAIVVVSSPIPSIQQVTTSPGWRWSPAAIEPPRRAGVPVATRSPGRSRTWRSRNSRISPMPNRI